jgi:hypothetical protein
MSALRRKSHEATVFCRKLSPCWLPLCPRRFGAAETLTGTRQGDFLFHHWPSRGFEYMLTSLDAPLSGAPSMRLA